MKYFYLTADGATAGPEPLETLCAMMSSGTLSLATLVVPAGGEDWTPLARVLRYFYQDASGATAGPVVFSELDRLCQIHAIPTDAWVVEESGTGWKAAAAVLSAGGVKLPAQPAAQRVVHATYRPQQATSPNPYAAPHAPVGRRTVMRHRPTGGMGRVRYILNSLALHFLSSGLLVAFIFIKSGHRTLDATQYERLTNDFLVLYLVMMVINLVGGTWLTALRIQNIGWSRLLVLLVIAPVIIVIFASLVPGLAKLSLLIPILGLLGIFAVIFQTSLLILPPGFARHKRLDAAAWILLAIIVVLIAAAISLLVVRKQPDLKEESPAPAPAASFLRTEF